MLDKYRFFLTFPDGEVEVYPDNDQLLWKDELNEDFGFWRRLLDTELIFCNNAHATYTALDTLDQDWGVCHKVLVRIQRRTGAATWSDCWNGFLPFRKGKNSASRASFYIKPRVDDVYTCFMQNYETEHNLFDIVERTALGTIEGDVVISQWYDIAGGILESNQTGHLTAELALTEAEDYANAYLAGSNWQLYEWEFRVIRDINGVYDWELSVKYCREETTSVPTNPNMWILEGSTYTRRLPLASRPDLTGNVTIGDAPASSYTNEFRGVYQIIDFDADNAVTFEDAMTFLFDQNCGVEIVSNFFNVNSTGSSPENDEYDQAAIDFANVVLFQASDLITPDEDNNATILNASFKKLIGSLKEKFPLVLYYDTSIGKYRLEHETFITQTLMLDMTQSSMIESLRGNREFEYESSDFPVREIWEDRYATGIDFTDAKIEYDPSCASDRDSDREKKYQSEDIIFDIKALYRNEELIEDKEIRTSIVMVALDGNNKIINGVGTISGNDIQNHPFASSTIIERYWLRSRPLLVGTMNGKQTTFLSTKPIRKQNEIQITMTQTDYWATFKPEDGIRTQYGWGQNVEPVEYDEPTQQMRVVPHFRIKPR